MPTPRVIDLSHHNSIPEDLLAAKEAGIIGVIHKLTEGTSHVDSKVQARFYLAKQAGLAWGIYHFLRPGDMQQQAEFFVETARELEVLDENTCYVADHEDQGVSGEELKEFLDVVENMTNCSPVVYSGHVLKGQLEGSGYRPKRRLWLAQYADEPELPEGVDEFWLWQYTDDGVIPGITPPTDLNDIGDQDIAGFLEGWAGHLDEKVPVPEPEPDFPTITISSDVPITIYIRPGDNVTIVEDWKGG